MKKKSVLIITLTMYIICMSFSASSAGTDYTAKPYDDDNDFTVSDISGGVTFVDGRECEMTKEEAQQAYIEELLYENRTEIFEKNHQKIPVIHRVLGKFLILAGLKLA